VSEPSAPEAIPRHIGLRSAVLLVVASMVGSGVFTTTGLLLRDLDSVVAVLCLWLLGGLLAGAGALAYAELTAALPENGGEYALLSRIYHPCAGFVAGFISLFVGFAAPIAASAIAFGEYACRLHEGGRPKLWAIGLILTVSCLHALGARLASRVQDAATILNVALIVGFIACGMWVAIQRHVPIERGAPLALLLGSGKAALGLVFVSFSYAGWNAAAYVAGEVRDPERTLPRALLLGTAIVAALYLGLNLVFLVSAPRADLRGVVEVGHVAAAHLFGVAVAPYVSALIALGLAASVGALTLTGARIYERMGRDHPRLRMLVSDRVHRGPSRAIALQTLVALALAATTGFDALLSYVGFTLALSSGLTLLGVFVLRAREPELARPYRAWGHPLTTLLALALMLWMVVLTLVERPAAGVSGLLTIAAGVGLYALSARRTR
jgi:basic amino acid/polyamine antiporter, APA family